MSDDLQTVNPDQVPVAGTVPENAFVFIQAEGGPIQKIRYNQFLIKLIKTDLLKGSDADLQLDLDWDADTVALVDNDPDPLKCGWYRKTGLTGEGDWVQFEQLAKAVLDSVQAAAAVIGSYADPGAADLIDFDGRSIALALTQIEALQAATIDSSMTPSAYALPLVIDQDGNVPLWLAGGKLDGTDIGPSLRSIIGADIDLAVDGSIDRSLTPSNRAVPLVIDQDGKVPLWLINGKLDGTGIGPELLAYIQTALQIDPATFALRDCPAASTAPVATDGRTLWKAHGKLATLAKSGTALLSIVLTGNSWSEQLPIAMGMRSYLEGRGYTWAGPGWIYVRPGDLGEDDDNQWPEVDLSFSGWSLWDVVDAGAPDTYGCGPDGHALWAVGTTATLDLTTVGTDFRIFYRKTLGTFVWSTDGGVTWSDPVTGDGSGDLGIVHIAGLAPGQHTLKIALTGNTDTVVLYAFHAIDTTVSGFVINKMGNGGAAGNDYLLWADQYIQPCAAEIGADVIIDNTVANDFRLASSNGVANTPATCAAAADAVAANWQAACPGAAVITVCPSLLNAAAGSGSEIPAYRDALYKACITYGREFANLCDTWGSWAEESANGQYADGPLGNLHPGTVGGYRIAKFLISTFLKPERLNA
ncbi:MAG: hypothetical protein AB7E24_00350 [Novosphingobium sp.]